jgi:hypothetical protein
MSMHLARISWMRVSTHLARVSWMRMSTHLARISWMRMSTHLVLWGIKQEMTLSQNFSDREAEQFIPIRKYEFVLDE